MTVLEVYVTQKYTFWGDILALSETRELKKEGQAIIFFISKLLLSICPDTLLVECLLPCSCYCVLSTLLAVEFMETGRHNLWRSQLYMAALGTERAQGTSENGKENEMGNVREP